MTANARNGPKDKRLANLSKRRRIELAAQKVVHEKWTQVKAAEHYGVSRGSVNEECKKLRPGAEAALAEAQAIASSPNPRIENERRRIPPFEEFDGMYWGRWQCPDCEKHHERPDFHNEIQRFLDDRHPRGMINLPPFHAKSTEVTVKRRIYEICANPNTRQLVISKSLPLARTFMASVQELLTNHELYADGPNLIEDWGPFHRADNPNQIWNTNQIYVAGRMTAEKDPTLQVLGYGGQIYGRRADDIVCDDIADTENQVNPDRVLSMLTWIDKMVASRIGKRGTLTFVGTRVHAGDIYSHLGQRKSYKVIRYPMILSDEDQLVLWPDHMPYSAALVIREDMPMADFQLVYQNIDTPGVGASFTPEILDRAKDLERVVGQYENGWRMVAGIDPAGAKKKSGFTAGVVRAVDLATGRRYHVDAFNVRSMKAPVIKDQMLDWADIYPIYEFRVEANGLQDQIFQYDEELVRELAQRGIRLNTHITGRNKWDAEFGIDAMAPLYHAGLVSTPWANEPTQRVFHELYMQYLSHPMGNVTDLLMADWFAELGIRDLLKREHMPLFDQRMRVPTHVKRRRRIIDFGTGEVRRVPLHEQSPGWRGPGARGHQRVTVGLPSRHYEQQTALELERQPFVNVGGFLDDEHPARRR